MRKKCPRCGKEKGIKNFNRGPEARRIQSWCRQCHREYAAERRKNNPEKAIEASRKYEKRHPNSGKEKRQKLRAAALEKYGNKCMCCGETTKQFLSFDHRFGGGRKHKEYLKARGINFFIYLRDRPVLKSIQILCHNCNLSLGFYGFCPHHPEIKRAVVRRCT